MFVKPFLRAFCIVFLAASLPVATRAELPELPLGDSYLFAPYGQLHLALQSFEDGEKRTTNLVDVTNANSRLGFYVQPEDNSAGLSFQFESGLGLRPSTATSQNHTPDFLDWSRRDLRQVQFIYKSRLGILRLGQGSMPLDGVAESDLGGTVIVAKSTIPEANGSYIFRTKDGALSDVTIGDTFSNFDGARRLRLRFDTAPVSGFSLAAAYGQEVLTKGNDTDYYDIAIRFSKTFGDIKVLAAAGSAFADDTSTIRTTIGSVSAMDTRTGLNLSMALGRNADTDAEYVYVKGGWNASWLDIGVTKLLFEGFFGNDYLAKGADSQMWGVAVIQNIDAANIEAYLGYRAFSYDDDSANDYQDANAIQFGARWRF